MTDDIREMTAEQLLARAEQPITEHDLIVFLKRAVALAHEDECALSVPTLAMAASKALAQWSE